MHGLDRALELANPTQQLDTHNMAIMDVQVQRSFIVPAPVVAQETGAAPSEVEVPLTVFDLVAPTYHVTALFAFSPPNPTNDALVAALSSTLPHFPLLTARRVERSTTPDRPFFLTGKGGAGALVVQAAVSSALSDHLPLSPSPELALLHPPDNKGTQHMLQLQINRFACGGIVIASSSHHQAADGYSMATFLHAWADAVRRDGGPPLDRPLPYGPGALVPRRPPRCEFEHRGAEFLPLSPHKDVVSSRRAAVQVEPSEITNMLLHYTSEFVAELKCRAQNKYTTFETMSAHVWRKITAARGLDGAARTNINVAVNGRGRLGTDAVPAGFFGNVVLAASSGACARDLASGSLADAAALVRAGIRAVDRRYFQSFIDFGALHGDEELEPASVHVDNVLSPDVWVDSWLHLELHRLDFGSGGRLAGVLQAKDEQDGEVVLLHSLRKEGGVEVFVALGEKHAKELMSIAYTMD